ncbi:MAG: hypothetical protein HY360_07290 [Verrucomicrobia bacterium]|nr:hypothetical protein [Verrucomicrobiota bacterium]
MKNSFPLIIGMAALALVDPARAENALSNGTFESDTSGWAGYLATVVNGQQTVIHKPSFVSLEAHDTAGKSKGALRGNIQVDDAAVAAGHSVFHNTGVGATLPKEFPANSTLKITFSAKSLEGSRYLCVTRVGGGAKHIVVELAESWDKYEMELPVQVAGSQIVFCTVASKDASLTPVNGEFLLDDVSVEIQPAGK